MEISRLQTLANDNSFEADGNNLPTSINRLIDRILLDFSFCSITRRILLFVAIRVRDTLRDKVVCDFHETSLSSDSRSKLCICYTSVEEDLLSLLHPPHRPTKFSPCTLLPIHTQISRNEPPISHRGFSQYTRASCPYQPYVSPLATHAETATLRINTRECLENRWKPNFPIRVSLLNRRRIIRPGWRNIGICTRVDSPRSTPQLSPSSRRPRCLLAG